MSDSIIWAVPTLLLGLYGHWIVAVVWTAVFLVGYVWARNYSRK